jgi:hypothetical protein
MTPQKRDVARAMMAAQPFVPADGPVELHSTHALNYIAYYLGEIEKHLSQIAANVENLTTINAPNLNAREKK